MGRQFYQGKGVGAVGATLHMGYPRVLGLPGDADLIAETPRRGFRSVTRPASQSCVFESDGRGVGTGRTNISFRALGGAMVATGEVSRTSYACYTLSRAAGDSVAWSWVFLAIILLSLDSGSTDETGERAVGTDDTTRRAN